MNERERIRVKQLLVNVALVTAVVCLIISLFFRTKGFTHIVFRFLRILTPFFYGGAIAYLLCPVCRFLERVFGAADRKIGKKRHPGLVRTAAIFLSIVFLFAVILLLLLMLLPELISSISSLVSQLPDAFNKFESWLRTVDNNDVTHEAAMVLQEAMDTISNKLENFLQTDLLPMLQTLVPNVTSSFMNLFAVVKDFGLGCIISAYILGKREKFAAQGKLILYGLLPEKGADWILDELALTDTKLMGFIKGKLVDSLIIGILCFIFTYFARMPYALLVSVIVGVTNIIPFFGPYLGAIPSALLILTVSPIKCLVFLVFIILLQQFDGNYLGPKLLGDRLGISGIWILFSILLFSSLWGILGMIIGVPVFAVLYDLFRRLIFRCLRRRSRGDMIEEYHQAFDENEGKEKKNAGAAGT